MSFAGNSGDPLYQPDYDLAGYLPPHRWAVFCDGTGASLEAPCLIVHEPDYDSALAAARLRGYRPLRAELAESVVAGCTDPTRLDVEATR